MAENGPSYVEYYERVLAAEPYGFKLVVGGTGLGKTSGILEVVKQHPDRKFIYIANRRRLLSEMQSDAESKLPAGSYVRIYRDIDQVQRAIRHAGFDELLDSELARQIDAESRSSQRRNAVLRAVERIRRLGGSDLPRTDLHELLEDEARVVMRFFRNLVSASDGHLFNDRVVQTLFPFIRFRHETSVNLALVTLQKLFFGVFDGETDVDLSNLSEYVIFLDEFDFLEQELLDLLCRAPEIDNVFEFVAPFYRVMQYSKLPYAGYAENHPRLKPRLKQIVRLVKPLRKKDGLKFPHFTQCFMSPVHTLPEQGVQIFHTDRAVSTAHLLIRQGERGFELAPARDVDWEDGINLSHVLGRLHNATRRILTLLKEYKFASPAVYEELREQCYGQSRSQYYDLVERIGQFPRKRLTSHNGFDSLLSSGYHVYEVQNLHQYTDPEAVEVRTLALYSTPERILYDLVTQNLVFGLSATADIERCLHNFDLKWLRAQQNVRWLPISDEDRQLVQEINDYKRKVRGNTVHVYKLPPLENVAIQRVVEDISGEEGFAATQVTKYHKQRLVHFFAALEWIVGEYAGKPEELSLSSHLMFFASYRQIELLFRSPEFRRMGSTYMIEPIDEAEGFAAYHLQFQGQEFIVVFLDSEAGENILENDKARIAYDKLFWSGIPVIVVTQFASAGAGVNLQYRLSEHAERNEWADFTHIYLLDRPFYFFHFDLKHPIKNRKKNIWQLAKLYHTKRISRREFIRLLGIEDGRVLSQQYISGHRTKSDAILNRVVTLIQALGRIERTWQAVPDQHVVLAPQVYDDLRQFIVEPDFEHLRRHRSALNSVNISAVFNEVKRLSSEERRSLRRHVDKKLPIKDRACRNALGALLDRLEALRQGENEHEARETWQHLRQAALRHDFALTVGDNNVPLLDQYHMLYRTPFLRSGAVWLDDNGNLVDPQLQVGTEFYLDAAYALIRDNPTIRDYFRSNGYELSFIDSAATIFTPYAYQAVLVGAIGEAAVKALLEHQCGPDIFEEVPDSLYELVDLKLKGRPTFIDAKYYSEGTLIRFGLDTLDVDYHPKLNSEQFAANAVRKLECIEALYGDAAKLVYLNLVSGQDRRLELFDSRFRPVEAFADASIFIVQGALDRNNPASLTHEMLTFLDAVQRGQI